MHVLVLSTVTDPDSFWGSLKQSYGRLPAGARWVLAVASTDGTRAVNVIVADSIESVRSIFDTSAGGFAATEYLEADITNAVGLPGGKQ